MSAWECNCLKKATSASYKSERGTALYMQLRDQLLKMNEEFFCSYFPPALKEYSAFSVEHIDVSGVRRHTVWLTVAGELPLQILDNHILVVSSRTVESFELYHRRQWLYLKLRWNDVRHRESDHCSRCKRRRQRTEIATWSGGKLTLTEVFSPICCQTRRQCRWEQ